MRAWFYKNYKYEWLIFIFIKINKIFFKKIKNEGFFYAIKREKNLKRRVSGATRSLLRVCCKFARAQGVKKIDFRGGVVVTARYWSYTKKTSLSYFYFSVFSVFFTVGLHQINATTSKAYLPSSSSLAEPRPWLSSLSLYLAFSLCNNGCLSPSQRGQPLQAHRRKLRFPAPLFLLLLLFI